MKKFEEKYPFVWLLVGLVLTLLSYGIFNTGICAWIFAIPLLRFINIRTKWSSIILMLIGMVLVTNITFYRLVEDKFNIKNQLFCTFNGIRIWAPFFVYFLCRLLKTKKAIAYYAFPAAVAVCEFFIDNPFISVMTSLSVSQFWNLGLMQLASITGVVGVSFIVTLLASAVNYVWENDVKKFAVVNAAIYGIVVVAITSLGMWRVTTITTGDKTLRVASCVDNFNMLFDKEFQEYAATHYTDDTAAMIMQTALEDIELRAEEAAGNGARILTFPEDAFISMEAYADDFVNEVKTIAKDNHINILLPLLRLPAGMAKDMFKAANMAMPDYMEALPDDGHKKKNTLCFINDKGELVNTYLKNHLVPVVEEPVTVKGDGNTPMVEVDGSKIIYLICADYTSNKYAYNGREADIFINPSYDWKAFQYFTSYGVQARAIECGFSVLRNPVNGNIVLYDIYGRPLHMANVMNVQAGMIYQDIPKKGTTTFYGMTGNWFPWACAIYAAFAILSGFFLKDKTLVKNNVKTQKKAARKTSTKRKK